LHRLTKELKHFLAPFSPEIIEIAQALRSMLLEEAAGATELVYDAYNAVALGYSFTGRLSEAFCHIAVYSHWVNLGFNRGAALPDVDGVFAGSGKRIRHIRMQSLADIERPVVRKLVRMAIAIAERPPDSRNPLATRSVVRAVYAKKRRPKYHS